MRYLALPVAVVALGLAPAGTTASAAHHASAACKPGYAKRQGETVNVFCGPARAVLTFGGKTYRFAQGNCTRYGGSLNLNIGALEVNAGQRRKFRYISIQAGAAPLAQFSLPPKGYILDRPRVTAYGAKTGGTFAGNVLVTGTTRSLGRATGHFSCG